MSEVFPSEVRVLRERFARYQETVLGQKAEIDELRRILTEVVSELGGACLPRVSLKFLAEVPAEARMTLAAKDAKIAKLEKALGKIAEQRTVAEMRSHFEDEGLLGEYDSVEDACEWHIAGDQMILTARVALEGENA